MGTDGFEDSSDIQESQARLEKVGEALQRHCALKLIIDAHAGIISPSPDAAEFISRARGVEICELLNLNRSVCVNAWGDQISHTASVSKHRNGELARRGKGWVELRLAVKVDEHCLMFPSRPSYYQEDSSEFA